MLLQPRLNRGFVFFLVCFPTITPPNLYGSFFLYSFGSSRSGRWRQSSLKSRRLLRKSDPASIRLDTFRCVIIYLYYCILLQYQTKRRNSSSDLCALCPISRAAFSEGSRCIYYYDGIVSTGSQQNNQNKKAFGKRSLLIWDLSQFIGKLCQTAYNNPY